MATLNPYQPTTEKVSRCASRTRLILHPAFAIAWIIGWCALTTSLIYLIHLVSPIPRIDRAFYFRLYASIGAVTGLLSWFTARLVALSKLRFGTLVILLLPLTLVFLLAIQLNLVVAGLTVIIAGTTFALAWLAQGGISESTRQQHGVDEPDDARESPS